MNLFHLLNQAKNTELRETRAELADLDRLLQTVNHAERLTAIERLMNADTQRALNQNELDAIRSIAITPDPFHQYRDLPF